MFQKIILTYRIFHLFFQLDSYFKINNYMYESLGKRMVLSQYIPQCDNLFNRLLTDPVLKVTKQKALARGRIFLSPSPRDGRR